MTKQRLFSLALTLLAVQAVLAPETAGRQTEIAGGVPVFYGDALAVSYRARIEGDWLVVEAVHEPGWHTYSMDNVTRARERSGKARPETELPTVITPLDGLTVDGGWRQSPPLDLSTPEIRWYTWGFEGRSFFAARLDQKPSPASVRIDAQACTAELCAMVEALVVPVDANLPGSEPSVDPQSLVPVVQRVESQQP